ncbi:MAG TPA: hypothetical protein VHZ32_18290 [Rhizomicrobium sp.]|nr:hypothetical protein [Rhizomicrobium sp.]
MAAAILWRVNSGVIFSEATFTLRANVRTRRKKASPESIIRHRSTCRRLPLSLFLLILIPFELSIVAFTVDIACGLRGFLVLMLFPIEMRCRDAGSGKRNQHRDLCPTTGQVLFPACARDAKRLAPAMFMPGLDGRHAAWHGFRSVPGMRPSGVPNWSRAALGQGSRVL